MYLLTQFLQSRVYIEGNTHFFNVNFCLDERLTILFMVIGVIDQTIPRFPLVHRSPLPLDL